MRELASDTAANDAKLDPCSRASTAAASKNSPRRPRRRASATACSWTICAACRGLDARGVRAVGGADLTDAHWLWGGTPQAIVTTILDGRTGVMPPFGAMLDAKAIGDLANTC